MHYTTKSAKSNLQLLPQELLPKIFGHLDLQNIKKIMKTSSFYKSLLSSNFLVWKLHSSAIHFTASEYISDIRTKHMLRKLICSGKNEHVLTFETNQSDLTSIQLNRDRLVCASDDQTIKVFNWNGKLEKTLVGHKGGVWTFMFDDKWLVSGSTDKTARIWNISAGYSVHVLTGHSSTIRVLKICGDYIVTGSRDSDIRVWNFHGVCLYTLKGHMQSVRSMDIDTNYLVSGSYDGTVILWDYKNGVKLHQLQSHRLRVYAVILGRRYVASSGLDKTVIISDLEGKPISSHKAHRGLVAWLRFDENEQHIISSGADGMICKWDILGRMPVFRIEEVTPISGHVILNNLLIVGTQKEVKIYDLDSGVFIRTLMRAFMISKIEVCDGKMVVGFHSEGSYQISIFSHEL